MVRFLGKLLFRVLLFLVLVLGVVFVLVNLFGAMGLEFWLESRLPCTTVSIQSLRLLPPYIRINGLYCLREDGTEVDISSISLKVDLPKLELAWVKVEGGKVRVRISRDKKESNRAGIYDIAPLVGFVALPVRELDLIGLELGFVKAGRDVGQVQVKRLVVYRPSLEKNYFSFKLEGVVLSGEKEGVLEVDGWLDWDGKNALFSVEGQGIDLSFLSELFALPELDGEISFVIEGEGKENDLVLKNKVKVSRFSAPRVESLKKIPVLPALIPVVDGLSRSEFSLEFTIRTRLDQPNLELKKHIMDAIRKMVKEPADNKENEDDEGQIYGIINDLVGLVGSVIGDLEDIVR